MTRVLQWAAAAVLAVLLALSARLAARRIYQIDECQNVYMASVIAHGWTDRFYTDASAFNVPLSFLEHGAARSRDTFRRARLAMLAVFWLNVVLLAACTGEDLACLSGLPALLCAATLAPLWDYGLEIRHDNMLLTGLLLTWLLLRVKPAGIRGYFLAGALAVVVELAVFKAFVYLIPLSLGFLIEPPKGHRAPRALLAKAWLAGALVSFVTARLLYGALGLWPVYLADARGYLGFSTRTARFLPVETLARLFMQTPLLLALTYLAARHWRAFKAESSLAAGALAALLFNPTPYPYNLVNFVPFLFLFAWRAAKTRLDRLKDSRVLAAILFGHLLPFAVSTARHFTLTNERQTRLMDLAEKLTSPQEPVYDAIGMVPTRPSAGFHWYIQSLNRERFLNGAWPSVREMLAKRPAGVVITSYRTDWLSKEDGEFIGRNYTALADDFWVLKSKKTAAVLAPGDHERLFVNWY